MAQQERPELLAPRPANIPDDLKARPRWACWRAEWNTKRGKWDKIPVHPSGYGLSTKRPDAWVSYDAAMAAYQANPRGLAGVGYLMTGDAGVVGIDLDNCVAANTIAPWAQEIVDAVASYTEVSPSGNGLRIFTHGATGYDWNNHDTGIEVYAGHTPRFLTVTGHRLKQSVSHIGDALPGVLDGLAKRYARERETATVISLAMPDLLDDLVLPTLAEIDLPYRTRDFLTEGATGTDRSRDLFTAAVDLFVAGLDEATVLSLLASNPHAMGIALDHRRQDHDRALMYLWVEHTQKARSRAAPRVASADDFEDVTPASQAAPAGEAVAPVKAAIKRRRFAPVTLDELLARPRPLWSIKRVLPEKGVGMVFGPSRSGKSFFVLDMSLAITRGVEWRGRKVRQGAVAYIVAEGMGGFAGRVQAYADYHGCEGAIGPLHIIPAAPNLLEKGDLQELIVELKALGPLQAVVVDTLAQTTPGADENSSQDMGRAITHCQTLADVVGALVLLVGHTGKDESLGPRGWSGMPAAFDVAIQLERSGDFRAATMLKVKDGEGEGDEYPFHLSSVVLGQDDDGEDITSMVVLGGNANGAVRAPEKMGPLQRVIFDTATTLLEMEPMVPTEALFANVKGAMVKPAAGATDNRTRDIKREFKTLLRRKLLIEVSGQVCLPAVET